MPQFMTLLRALQLVTVQNETAWAEALDRMRRSSIVAEPPYVDLRPYATTESSLFVGGERSLEELLDACSRTRPPRIVMVVGASGAGKSSLLAAGLIGHGTAPDGPLSHLNPVQSMVRDLLGWKTPTEATLLVVDQFEELQQLEATEAGELVDTLCRLPDHVTCVIGLNANAVGTVLRQERLAPFLASPVLVGPLTTAEYRQIIEVPARHHGRAVSTELTHVLIRDLHQYGYPDPGIVLPLLSNTLKRCWNAASGETLTTSDYLASGGLWTSLNDEAEAVWQDLPAQDRPLVRCLMLSLVVVDANRLLRRSIPFGSLSSQMVPVAEAFIASRLLTHSEDHLTITHEAFLTRWHRLRGWVVQEEATLLVGRRIHMATKLWDEGGRAPEGLMPVEAEMWQSWARAEDAPVISKNEHEFIDASLALGRAHEEEQENRLKHTRRQRRTALGIATVAVVLAVVAAFLGIHSAALTQQANTAARAARAQQLALVSDQIRNTDPNEAAQLAVAAHRLEENPRTRSTVIESAGGTAPLRINGAAGNTMVAVAPGSDIVLRGDSQGNLAVWRDGNLKSEPELVETDGGQLFAVQPVLRDGRYLVIVAGQRTASVWDLTTSARKLGEWAVAGVTSYSAAWQGTVALIGNLHGEVQRIDLTNPERPEVRTPLLTGEDVAVTALTATPDLIVASASRNRLALFDSAGTALPDFQVPGQVMSLDVSEDGKEILAGSSASKALLLEVSGTALRTNHEFLMKSGVHAVRHLGDQVALGGSQGEVVIANRTGEITERRPLRSVVTSISRGSAGLLTGTAEGTLSLWPPLPTLLRTNGVKIHDIRRMGGKTIITTADGPRVLDSTAPGSPELTVPTSPGGGWIPAPRGIRCHRQHLGDAVARRQGGAAPVGRQRIRDGTGHRRNHHGGGPGALPRRQATGHRTQEPGRLRHLSAREHGLGTHRNAPRLAGRAGLQFRWHARGRDERRRHRLRRGCRHRFQPGNPGGGGAARPGGSQRLRVLPLGSSGRGRFERRGVDHRSERPHQTACHGPGLRRPRIPGAVEIQPGREPPAGHQRRGGPVGLGKDGRNPCPEPAHRTSLGFNRGSRPGRRPTAAGPLRQHGRGLAGQCRGCGRRPVLPPGGSPDQPGMGPAGARCSLHERLFLNQRITLYKTSSSTNACRKCRVTIRRTVRRQ